MPVRNKQDFILHEQALSEYKKKFRWHDSVKSPSYKPSPAQKLPFAGLSSADFGQQEPPLQHKQHPLPVDSKVTHTTKQIFGDASHNGDSDVGRKGRAGVSGAAVMPQKTYKVNRREDHGSNTHQTTTKPDKLSLKSKTDPPTESHPGNVIQAAGVKITTDSGEANVNNNRDVGHYATKDSRGNGEQDHSKTTHKHKTKPNVALQYKAGIRDMRPKTAKYLSEYQRSYEWRKAMPKESPLMAAEQMVYKSHANVAPFIPDKIPRQSEYKVQFRDWSPVRHRPTSHQQQLIENAEREIKAKYRIRTKSKKSKRSSLTPEKMRPAGVPSVYAHDDLKLLKSAENPSKPFFPHSTTLRRWKSEYSSNFKSPDIYRYESGIWKGADPAHISPKDDSSVNRKDARPSWFDEVLGLRQKADDYRKRAQGTHFSREHLAQILANQARLWDESSTATSTISSLSAPSVDNGLKENKQDSKPVQATRSEDSPPVRRRLAWPQAGNKESKKEDLHEGRNGESKPSDNNDQESSIGSIPTPEGYKGSVTPSSDEVETIEEQGRLPTPRLREEGLSKRHHLDRTTPATGGAILTSPEPKHRSPPTIRPAQEKSSMQPAIVPTVAHDHRRNIIPGHITQGFAYDSDEDTDDELSITPRVATPPPHPDARTRILERIQSSPTAGVTTRDPDPIREVTEHQRPQPLFQRHSNNFFETSPAMPVMPRKIEPPPAPRTWAAQERLNGRDQSDGVQNGYGETRTAAVSSSHTVPVQTRPGTTQAHGVKGPLDRPNSGSMHGRPMTAHPQTRQEAGSGVSNHMPTKKHNSAQSSAIPPAAPRKRNEGWTVPTDSPGGRVDYVSPQQRTQARDSDELSVSTLSIASTSSSLASEVLERARRRRDDFWGK